MSNLLLRFFRNPVLLLILAHLAIGCSEPAFVEEPGEEFIDQLRELVSVHMEPDKENVLLFMGIVGPELRQHSLKSGVIEDIDYVFATDHPDIAAFGFDVMSSPEEAFKKLGVRAETCAIPFDTPVNQANADAWAEHEECVINLVEECRTVFSHVDGESNWVTDCMDPRGQLSKEEFHLIEDPRKLTSACLG